VQALFQGAKILILLGVAGVWWAIPLNKGLKIKIASDYSFDPFRLPLAAEAKPVSRPHLYRPVYVPIAFVRVEFTCGVSPLPLAAVVEATPLLPQIIERDAAF
jgi:hypothetical protein